MNEFDDFDEDFDGFDEDDESMDERMETMLKVMSQNNTTVKEHIKKVGRKAFIEELSKMERHHLSYKWMYELLTNQEDYVDEIKAFIGGKLNNFSKEVVGQIEAVESGDFTSSKVEKEYELKQLKADKKHINNGGFPRRILLIDRAKVQETLTQGMFSGELVIDSFDALQKEIDKNSIYLSLDSKLFDTPPLVSISQVKSKNNIQK